MTNIYDIILDDITPQGELLERLTLSERRECFDAIASQLFGFDRALKWQHEVLEEYQNENRLCLHASRRMGTSVFLMINALIAALTEERGCKMVYLCSPSAAMNRYNFNFLIEALQQSKKYSEFITGVSGPNHRSIRFVNGASIVFKDATSKTGFRGIGGKHSVFMFDNLPHNIQHMDHILPSIYESERVVVCNTAGQYPQMLSHFSHVKTSLTPWCE